MHSAQTGTGGRLRDGHATGRASLVIAGNVPSFLPSFAVVVCFFLLKIWDLSIGTVGYCVGVLQIPGYELPWEAAAKSWAYTAKVAPPLQVAAI